METLTSKLVLLSSLILAAAAAHAATEKAAPANVPTAEEIMARLKKEHPRLLASAQDFTTLKQRVQDNAQVKQWYEKLRASAEKILKEEPSKYEIPDGLRLLATSRRVMNRTYTLAMIYRLHGDKRFLDRAWQELQAAANFKDWNPRHFLDTAEMTHAFAIAYDWLYDSWSDEQRATLRNAMIEKGLKPALEIYRKGNWWVAAHHNWNQVCNGGIGMGALAIGDEVPDLAGEILSGAVKSLPRAMKEFGPDGAWAEGPGYWDYATTYNVVILAAMDSALGTDFGLSQIPGFSRAGDFPIYAAGPVGKTFNYADAGDKAGGAAQLFWFARKFDQPDYAAYQAKFAAQSPRALDLLWGSSWDNPKMGGLPLDKYFRNSEVVTMRSAWDDPNALFVAFKAGDNKANHSHLDLGTFVLDALGQRWALDLGADNYNLPAYFGNKRWTYYRLRAEGHNTLVINPGEGPDQDPKAATTITRFDAQPQRAFALADLTPAYKPHAQQVQRGLALLERRMVLVQDEIKAEKPAEVWWFMHTHATVQIAADGTTATLTQGKARLWARLLSPAEAKFEVLDAQPLPTSPHPEGQRNNEGIRKLTIHLTGATDARLAVLLVPLKEGEDAPAQLPEVRPLAEW